MENKKKLFKITILSISLLLTSASAISMTIPQIQATFPNMSSTTIESLVTVPSFTMMIFVLLSGFISSKIGSKNTVLMGLFLTLIGGVTPVLTQNFTLIYLSRFLFGAGLGSYNSLAVSLINDFYEGDEKQTMIGFQSAVQSLGSCVATFIAGILASIHWQYAFIVYFAALPILIVFYFVVPNTKKVAYDENHGKQKVNLKTLLYALGLFAILAFVMVVFTKTGTLASDRNMDTSFLGTALSLMTLSGFLAGLAYGKVHKIFKKYTPVVGGAISTISFILLSMATNIIFVSICLILIGFCLHLFIPYIFTSLLASSAAGSQTLAISIGMVGSNLGSFASPYIISFLTNLFGSNTASFSLFVSGLGFLILTIIFSLDIMFTKDSKESKKKVRSFS